MKKERKQKLLAFLTSISMMLPVAGCSINDNNSIQTSYKISQDDKNKLLTYKDYLDTLGIVIDNCEIFNETEDIIYIKERIYQEYTVKDVNTVDSIVYLHGMDEKEFLQMNNLKENTTTFEENTQLYVYYYQFYNINKKVNYNNEWIYYQIQAGDNLTKIASKYNTTIEELCEINDIKNENLINTGDIIKIPNPEKVSVKVK